MGSIMGVAVPQLVYLEKYWPVLPFYFVTFFTSISLIFIHFCLPETKGRPLPETIEDLDKAEFGAKNLIGTSKDRKTLLQQTSSHGEEEQCLLGKAELPEADQ